MWKTGLVWPPKPACFLSYRRLPVRVRQGVGVCGSTAAVVSGERAGTARHVTTLLWSCELQELRPRRLTAATKEPYGAGQTRSAAAAMVPPQAAAPSLAQAAGRLGGSKERDASDGGRAAAKRPPRPFSRHTESVWPALHQRLAPESWSTPPPLLAASWHAQQEHWFQRVAAAHPARQSRPCQPCTA